MSKKLVFDLNLNVGDAQKSIEDFLTSTSSAKIKLKELEKAAIEASLNGNAALSEKFAKAAGQLKDIISDTRKEINNFASDTRKLDVAIGAVQGIAGAFASTAGAVGLLSGENKDLQKTIATVTSSLAILNGIQQVSNTLNKNSATGAALYSAANKVLNFSIKETAVSLGVFRTALIATGIGAAVVALGLLIANFEKLKSILNGVSKTDKNLLESAKAKVDASEKELKNISDSENILKRQGKTQREILELRINAVKGAIKEQEIVLQTTKNQRDAQIKAAERNKEILKGILDFVSIPLTLILETVDQVGKAFGKNFGLREGFKDRVANLIFDPEETKKKGDEEVAAQQETLNKLKNELAGFELAVKEIDNKSFKERQERIKKEAEEAKKTAESIREAEIRAINDKNQQELAAFDEKAKKEIESAKGNFQLIEKLQAAHLVERQKIIDRQAKEAEDKRKQEQQKEKEDLKKKFDEQLSLIRAEKLKQIENQTLSLDKLKELNDKEIQIFKEQYDLKLITEEEYLQAKLSLNEKYNNKKKELEDKDKERETKLNEFKINSADSTFGILNDINATFANQSENNAKKAFENNKKIQIAETLISTYFAAQKAYTSQILPGDPTSLIRAKIAAGLSIAAGLARVAKIKSTTLQGGFGGSNDSSVSSGERSGSFNPFINPPEASRVIVPEGISNRNPSNQRVYVLESDITKTQERVRVIESNSNAQF